MRVRLDNAQYYTQNDDMQARAQIFFAEDSWQAPRNARTLAAYMALRNREIGERIAALRQAKGNPPQEIVAQKLGVSHRSYQSWEAGDTKPSWRNLAKLARYYGTSEEVILRGDAIKPPEPEPSQLDRIEAALAGLTEFMEQVREVLRDQGIAHLAAQERSAAAPEPKRAPRRPRP